VVHALKDSKLFIQGIKPFTLEEVKEPSVSNFPFIFPKTPYSSPINCLIMASLQPLQGKLGHRKAAHLLRRTSYRFTKTKVDQMAEQTAAQALDSLLQLYPLKLEQPIYTPDANTPAVTWCLPVSTTLPAEDFVLRRWVMTWWTYEALQDPGIGHKMAFFWHQYMIVTATAFGNTHFFDYLSLMRWGALGNFKKMAAKLVLDNCMLRYLNNNENTKNNPQENFAREFFELFTIGKGPQVGPGDYTNYTEDDIVAAARLLTGMRSNAQRNTPDPETNIPRGVFNVNLHDTSAKTFSKHFQNKTIAGGTTVQGMQQELAAFVDMIFAQSETAKNLCRRLYRFFVGPVIDAEIEKDIITPLANLLISNNYEVKPVLSQLLQSQHFFDADDSNTTDEIYGSLIKSPLELTYQPITFFNIPIPDPLTKPMDWFNVYNRAIFTRFFSGANFPIFFANDVAGYPAYHQAPDYTRQWFSSATIIARYKLPQQLLSGKASYGAAPNTQLGLKLNIVPWVKNSGITPDPSDSYELVKALLTYLMPEAVDSDRFDYFHRVIFLDNLPPDDWTYEWKAYLSTGKETEVIIPLERLINAIMYSQEFQTF
jgi:uncharacterized protein (DUF1800 family)